MKTTITFLIALFISTTSIAQYAIASYSSGTYNDISSSGVFTNLGDDDEYNITVPFTIYLGTQSATNLRIGNNGAVLFDVTTGDVDSTNAALSTSSPMIAPFWDDLDSEMGNVVYDVIGTTPNRQLIIQWDRVAYMSDPNTNADETSFQVIFYEANRNIIFHYDDVDLDGTANDNGISATVGIATTDEVSQHSFNTSSLSDDLELAFEPTNTYVPDDNFENYLETHKADGTVVAVGDANSMGNGIADDNFVTTNRIIGVTTLDASSKSIANLTGVERFVALTHLNCEENSLINLNLNGNPNLIELDCSNNSIANIDVSNNISLAYLQCSNNSLISLNISNNTNLETLHCWGNTFSNLDLSHNTLLINFDCRFCSLPTIDVSHNTNLENLGLGDNSLTSLDVSHNPNLQSLDFWGNNIVSIDISMLPDLFTLGTFTNPLTNLDVSHNPALKYLECNNNSLTSLDLSANTNLIELKCYDNSLSYLNIANGNNSNMTEMYASSNPNLTCIQVDDEGNTPPTGATWSKDAGASYSDNCHYNETYVPDNNFEAYLETHSADGTPVAVGNTYSLGNGIDNDDYVDTSQIATVTMLEMESEGIADLTGINSFIAIEHLNLSDNELTSLNLNNVGTLTELYCNSNLLVALNIANGNNSNMIVMDATDNANLTCIQVDDSSNIPVDWQKDYTASYSDNCHYGESYVPDDNFEAYLEANAMGNSIANDNYVTTANISSVNSLNVFSKSISDLTGIEDFTSLTSLTCSNNSLANLDVSNNSALSGLYCSNNSLTSLDVSNNTNLVFIQCFYNSLTSLNLKNGNNNNMATMDATNNPNLDCIQVDDSSNIPVDWQKDATASYSNDCSAVETYVPDNNFEAYLEANAMGNGIANDNYVTTSNISSVINLFISDKSIADLTGIADFTSLKNIDCDTNSLTSLDLSNNTALEALSCAYNTISSLNLSSNTNLKSLTCMYTSLADLDVSSNVALTELYCYNNSLTSLNIANGNNSNMVVMYAENNPNLTCIQVDDETNSPPTGMTWTKDATASYSDNCSSLGYDDETQNFNFIVYPNPVKDSFTIRTQEIITSVEIYDYLGKQVASYPSQDSYTINEFSSGIYIVKVAAKNTYGIKRIVVE